MNKVCGSLANRARFALETARVQMGPERRDLTFWVATMLLAGRISAERARELGLDSTSYANPIGFDDPLNYSTARDLAALTVKLLRRPRFARTVDTRTLGTKSRRFSAVCRTWRYC